MASVHPVHPPCVHQIRQCVPLRGRWFKWSIDSTQSFYHPWDGRGVAKYCLSNVTHRHLGSIYNLCQLCQEILYRDKCGQGKNEQIYVPSCISFVIFQYCTHLVLLYQWRLVKCILSKLLVLTVYYFVQFTVYLHGLTNLLFIITTNQIYCFQNISNYSYW